MEKNKLTDPIKISIEGQTAGTATTWINPETGEVIRQDGKPSSQYAYIYNEAIRKLIADKGTENQASYCNPEQIEKIKELFPPNKHGVVFQVIGKRNRDWKYSRIAMNMEISESTVKSWCKKIGLTKTRKKKK